MGGGSLDQAGSTLFTSFTFAPSGSLFDNMGDLSDYGGGIVSPYGIYLARICAAAAVPDTVVEAARVDGASEFRIFRTVALPMKVPGMITVFLVQFVAIWNNFLLPFIMLADDKKFPVTLGLYTLLNRGATEPALYSLVITGVLLSMIPLVAVFLALQRYWRVDLLSRAVKA